VVRTALLWHKDRAKIQWNFLTSSQRYNIKWEVGMGIVATIFLVQDIFFPSESYFLFPRWVWIVTTALWAWINFYCAWIEYTDHLSPKLFTHDELTEGTE
jgi:hypothetical protein